MGWRFRYARGHVNMILSFDSLIVCDLSILFLFLFLLHPLVMV